MLQYRICNAVHCELPPQMSVKCKMVHNSSVKYIGSSEVLVKVEYQHKQSRLCTKMQCCAAVRKIYGVKGSDTPGGRGGRDGHLKPQQGESSRLHKCLSSMSRRPSRWLKSVQAVIFVLSRQKINFEDCQFQLQTERWECANNLSDRTWRRGWILLVHFLRFHLEKTIG